MRCEVCQAPALPRDGACRFCKSRLVDGVAHPSVLSYLAERVPGARVKRYGLLRRGPVRRLEVTVAGELFTAEVRRDSLRTQPEPDSERWLDRLLKAVARHAESDSELRAAVSRSGWSLD